MQEFLYNFIRALSFIGIEIMILTKLSVSVLSNIANVSTIVPNYYRFWVRLVTSWQPGHGMEFIYIYTYIIELLLRDCVGRVQRIYSGSSKIGTSILGV